MVADPLDRSAFLDAATIESSENHLQVVIPTVSESPDAIYQTEVEVRFFALACWDLCLTTAIAGLPCITARRCCFPGDRSGPKPGSFLGASGSIKLSQNNYRS